MSTSPEITPAVLEHWFGWMRDSATWRREHEIIYGMWAEIERLRGLSDITRLDVMWQELVKERYAAEDNAVVLAAEVQNLRAEIERLRNDPEYFFAFQNGWNARNTEIERLRREHEMAWADAQLKAAEIERMRETYKTDLAETLAEKVTLKAEIERLRQRLIDAGISTGSDDEPG